MSDPTRVELARTLLAEFARRGRRYLWTDAFAVGNLLGLARTTGDEGHAQLALRLITDVHHTLGRHRGDDGRTGWLSGLPEAEGEAHPTRGGLRIGKPLPERGPQERADEALEWERDGQYFHYLTKWMGALDQATRATGDGRFTAWAAELAEAAHRAFTYRLGEGVAPRMYWKMSIDLSRPLVPSMGQHDALDGWVSCLQIEATRSALGPRLGPGGPSLADARADFAAMIEPRALATGDPLGLGGLLADAHRLHQLAGQGAGAGLPLLEPLLAAAAIGLPDYLARGELRAPARRRLAFRELGLAIGLAAVERLAEEVRQRRFLGSARAAELVGQLAGHRSLRADIEACWRLPEHRSEQGWREHLDINEVMLATALAPEGFLELPLPR